MRAARQSTLPMPCLPSFLSRIHCKEGRDLSALRPLAERRLCQRSFALLPITRAELVRLERIEHTQYLLRIAAHRQVGHINEADNIFRINDEGRALRHACLLV